MSTRGEFGDKPAREFIVITEHQPRTRIVRLCGFGKRFPRYRVEPARKLGALLLADCCGCRAITDPAAQCLNDVARRAGLYREPMTLEFKGVRRQRNAPARMVGIEGLPVEFNAVDLQGRSGGKQRAPVVRVFAERRKPRRIRVRQAAAAHADKGVGRADLEEHRYAMIGEGLHAAIEQHGVANVIAPVFGVQRFAAFERLAGAVRHKRNGERLVADLLGDRVEPIEYRVHQRRMEGVRHGHLGAANALGGELFNDGIKRIAHAGHNDQVRTIHSGNGERRFLPLERGGDRLLV